MTLKRHQINNAIEEKILTNLITNKEFSRVVYPILDTDYFQSEYIRKIVKWCENYYDEYNEPPDKLIQSLYDENRYDMGEEESGLIAIFLTKLSQKFEEEEGNNKKDNSDYLIKGAKDYFRKRSLVTTADRIHFLAGQDKLDEAEICLRNYKEISKSVTRAVDIFDYEFAKKILDPSFRSRNELFTMDGALGRLIGPFKRNQLVGVLGRFKGGKSWILQEFAINAMLEGCNVLYISLEMDENEIAERIYKRMCLASFEEKDFRQPIFDCTKNQNGVCSNKNRKNKIALAFDDEAIPEYSPDIKYDVCTFCREKPELYENYAAAVWYETVHKEAITDKKWRDTVKGWYGLCRNNLKILPYPINSANFAMIRNDIDSLEYVEDFTADVIVLDYINILAPEDKKLDPRARVDESWKMAKNLCATKKCLLISGHQSNRSGLETKNLKVSNTSEDIRVLAHVDTFLQIDQDDEEKEAQKLRISVGEQRGRNFNKTKEVLLLQQLDWGQPILDSEFLPKKITKNKNFRKNDED